MTGCVNRYISSSFSLRTPASTVSATDILGASSFHDDAPGPSATPVRFHVQLEVCCSLVTSGAVERRQAAIYSVRAGAACDQVANVGCVAGLRRINEREPLGERIPARGPRHSSYYNAGG